MVSDEDMEIFEWFIAQIENEMHEMLARMGQDGLFDSRNRSYVTHEVIITPPLVPKTEITSAATLKCQFCGCTVPTSNYEAHLETHAGPDMPDMC